MKLEIRLEDGKPIIFWTDNPDDRPHEIAAYGMHCEHVTASRGYMRKCKKPETVADFESCMKTLAHWARIPCR